MEPPAIQLSRHELGKFRTTPERMLTEFLKQGYVDQACAKLRKRFYDLLRSKRIPFDTKVLGFDIDSGKTVGTLKKRGTWPTTKIASWISHQRILLFDVEQVTKNSLFQDWDIELIRAAFADGLSTQQRAQIIQQGWGDRMHYNKYTPFYYVPLRLTLVRIWSKKLI